MSPQQIGPPQCPLCKRWGCTSSICAASAVPTSVRTEEADDPFRSDHDYAFVSHALKGIDAAEEVIADLKRQLDEAAAVTQGVIDGRDELLARVRELTETLEGAERLAANRATAIESVEQERDMWEVRAAGSAERFGYAVNAVDYWHERYREVSARLEGASSGPASIPKSEYPASVSVSDTGGEERHVWNRAGYEAGRVVHVCQACGEQVEHPTGSSQVLPVGTCQPEVSDGAGPEAQPETEHAKRPETLADGRDYLADVREVLADTYHPEGVEVWLDSTKGQPDTNEPTRNRTLIERGHGRSVLVWAERTVGRTLDEIRAAAPQPSQAEGEANAYDAVNERMKRQIVEARASLLLAAASEPGTAWALKSRARGLLPSSTVGLAFGELIDEGRLLARDGLVYVAEDASVRLAPEREASASGPYAIQKQPQRPPVDELQVLRDAGLAPDDAQRKGLPTGDMLGLLDTDGWALVRKSAPASQSETGEGGCLEPGDAMRVLLGADSAGRYHDRPQGFFRGAVTHSGAEFLKALAGLGHGIAPLSSASATPGEAGRIVRCWVDANRAGSGRQASGSPRWVRADYTAPAGVDDESIAAFEEANQRAAGLAFDGGPFPADGPDPSNPDHS